MQRPQFTTQQEYGARFTDAAYWRPYVEAVCARHGLMCDVSVAGLPGTNPVFLVNNRYAVKFYTELFDSGEGFPIELDVYQLLADTELPAPKLLAHGALFPSDQGWPWPYLITTLVHGTSLGEARPHVTYVDLQGIAAFLGALLRRFHTLSLKDALVLHNSWDGFTTFLEQQRHTCIDKYTQLNIPEHLVVQLDRYLPPIETLVDRASTPRLMHADLNEDHVLGRYIDSHWQPTGIIDFADAMVGDWLYELGALHIGLFRCDKRLLRIFLANYGSDTALQHDFVLRAMSFVLLHRWNVLGRIFRDFPHTREVASLEELASMLWDVDAPALPGSEIV